MSGREKTILELIAERRALLDNAEKLAALTEALDQGVMFVQRGRGELALVASGKVQASVKLPKIPETGELIEKLQGKIDHWWALNRHRVSRRASDMVNAPNSFFDYIPKDAPEPGDETPF